MEHFKNQVKEDGEKYVKVVNQFGLYGKSIWTIGTDPVNGVYMIDSEDTSEGKLREKSVSENVNQRKNKVTDCDHKEMNIIFIR